MDDGMEMAPASRLLPSRLVIGCFLMGTINNLTFVITNSSATDILPGHVGIVYIINTLPELIVKGTAPWWWHYSGYGAKFLFAGACFGANLVLVSAGLHLPTGWVLLGVVFADLGGGLGEASMLALSQSYAEPQAALSAWSSGTGAAGVLGYVLSMHVLPHLGEMGKLVFAALLLAAYWFTFFVLLPRADRPVGTASMGGPLLSSAEGMPAGGEAAREAAEQCAVSASFDGDGACGDEAAGNVQVAAEDSPAAPLSTGEKFAMQAKLVPYVLPLMQVYWSEYAIQAGAWTSFSFDGPLDSPAARTRAYQQLNLFYQIGVLVSRSAGRLFTLSLPLLWAAAWAQVAMLVLFVADGALQLWVGPSLVLAAIIVGLFGGTNYIQSMLAIDRQLPPRMRELALATITIGAPVGILLADATGLLVQWCLFRYHAIHLDGGWCPVIPSHGNASTLPS